MISKRICAAALLAATALGFAAPASAQRVDRIVAFGDSYADTGNFFKFVGVNPATGTGGLYTTGRFSGGTNYIDTLSDLLHAPVDNFAIGGALTYQFNTNTGPSLGFPTEYGSFLTGGAGATPFPAVSGTFDEHDLLAISVGGNDARIYQTGSVGLGVPVGTLGGAHAAGATSAAYATAGLDLLVAAGAPTISYLAGNTANIPEIYRQADPAAAFAIRDAFFQSFDSAMRDTLSGYAASGVMVHYLDLNLVGERVQSDYAAYGLTGLTCPHYTVDPICVTNPDVAKQYLFYADQLHLTSAGFAIVAHYIAAHLTGPLTLSAPSEIALDAANQWGRTLTSRMDLGSPRDGDMPEGMHAYLVGDTVTHGVNADDETDAFRSTSKGVTAGFSYGFGSGVAGAAINYSKPHANFGNDAAEDSASSVQLGGYAGFGIAGAFAQAYAGFGWDKHDLKRQGVIDAMEADVDGSHSVAGIKAGYLMPVGPVRLGPVAALDYARAKVDSYVEDGDEALTLAVDSVRYRSLRGSLGAELRGDFGGNGIQLRPYAAAVVEKDFKGDDRAFRFAQTSAPEIVNGWEVGGSKKAYGRLTTGGSAAILDNLTLDLSLSATSGKPNGNETSGHLGLKMGF